MVKRNHPCALDCPNRSATCHSECAAWQEYEAQKFLDYKRIEHLGSAEDADYLRRLARHTKPWKSTMQRKKALEKRIPGNGVQYKTVMKGEK